MTNYKIDKLWKEVTTPSEDNSDPLLLSWHKWFLDRGIESKIAESRVDGKYSVWRAVTTIGGNDGMTTITVRSPLSICKFCRSPIEREKKEEKKKEEKKKLDSSFLHYCSDKCVSSVYHLMRERIARCNGKALIFGSDVIG